MTIMSYLKPSAATADMLLALSPIVFLAIGSMAGAYLLFRV